MPSLKDFEKFVRQKTKDLKDEGGREIEYTVSIENGRVKSEGAAFPKLTTR